MNLQAIYTGISQQKFPLTVDTDPRILKSFFGKPLTTYFFVCMGVFVPLKYFLVKVYKFRPILGTHGC